MPNGVNRPINTVPLYSRVERLTDLGTPTVFLRTPAHEMFPAISPDGDGSPTARTRPAAARYTCGHSGSGGPWRVSMEGGMYPRWSTTTDGLLFLNLNRRVMFAAYAIDGNSFRADKPQVWSPTGLIAAGGPLAATSPYDLHPDGKRLAVWPRGSERQRPGSRRVRLELLRSPAEDRAGERMSDSHRALALDARRPRDDSRIAPSIADGLAGKGTERLGRHMQAADAYRWPARATLPAP